MKRQSLIADILLAEVLVFIDELFNPLIKLLRLLLLCVVLSNHKPNQREYVIRPGIIPVLINQFVPVYADQRVP
jgi:hypothetical protein